MKKSEELKSKSKDELNHLLAEFKAKLLKLNFDLADNKVQDVSQIGKTKRNIARVMTALNHLNK